MRPARGEYPCGNVGCPVIATSPGQLGGHKAKCNQLTVQQRAEQPPPAVLRDPYGGTR